MQNIKQATLQELDGKNLNGYEWVFFENGMHYFKKKEAEKWAVIKASPEDLTNGNIEFMTEHGLTRS